MASPIKNSLRTEAVDPFDLLGNHLAASLLGPRQWLWSGKPLKVTYSFPEDLATHIDPYSSRNEWSAWQAIEDYEKGSIVSALDRWAAVTGLRFVEVADDALTVGDLRFAKSMQVDAGFAGHAYLPADHPSAGDIWFKPDSWHGYTNLGDHDFLASLHEIGHALGLRHSFEWSNGNPPLSGAYDNHFYTVMSYSASPWTRDGYASFHPTTPMFLDIVAIQALYGQVYRNPGNDTYIFHENAEYWETITDSGGTDKIVYLGTRGTVIDLRPGAFSKLSTEIYFSDGISSRATVCIGPDVMIEAARGGDGADTLGGNRGNNVLNGDDGNDRLHGREGHDRLYGSAGHDLLVGGKGRDRLYGSEGHDRFDFNALSESGRTAKTRDQIMDFERGVDVIDLRSIDATAGSGNDGFKFVKAAAFKGAGQLRIKDLGSDVIVQADVNGDRKSDFEILVRKVNTLTSSDFLF
jgi:Ca2+-binding RTX toxin-like protein